MIAIFSVCFRQGTLCSHRMHLAILCVFFFIQFGCCSDVRVCVQFLFLCRFFDLLLYALGLKRHCRLSVHSYCCRCFGCHSRTNWLLCWFYVDCIRIVACIKYVWITYVYYVRCVWLTDNPWNICVFQHMQDCVLTRIELQEWKGGSGIRLMPNKRTVDSICFDDCHIEYPHLIYRRNISFFLSFLALSTR